MIPAGEAGPRLPLSAVLTVPQVAKMAKWTRGRMRRYLVAKDRELGGTLLVNAGQGKLRPRWTVSLYALQALNPQWFNDPELFQRELDVVKEENEELKWRLTRLEKIVEMQTKRIISLVNANGRSAA